MPLKTSDQLSLLGTTLSVHYHRNRHKYMQTGGYKVNLQTMFKGVQARQGRHFKTRYEAQHSIIYL
jgi:hypothetical protein